MVLSQIFLLKSHITNSPWSKSQRMPKIKPQFYKKWYIASQCDLHPKEEQLITIFSNITRLKNINVFKYLTMLRLNIPVIELY